MIYIPVIYIPEIYIPEGDRMYHISWIPCHVHYLFHCSFLCGYYLWAGQCLFLLKAPGYQQRLNKIHTGNSATK